MTVLKLRALPPERYVHRYCTSFKHTGLAIQAAKEEASCAKLGGEFKVATFAILECALNFKIHASVLCLPWELFLAIDGGTRLDTSYLDVRVRFAWQGRMCNCHVASLSMLGSYTGLAQFNQISKLLDVLCLRWNETLNGVSSDSAHNMTSAAQRIVTRLQQASTIPGFIRDWCLLHQMEEAWMDLDGGTFMTELLTTISHLRRHQRLSDATRSTCPKMSFTRSHLLYRITRWLDEHRVAVLAHYISMSQAHSTTAPTCMSRWLLNTITAPLTYSMNAAQRFNVCKGSASRRSNKPPRWSSSASG